MHKLGDCFAKQVNLKEIFWTQTTNIMYLKASTSIQNLNIFEEKWGDEAVDHKMVFKIINSIFPNVNISRNWKHYGMSKTRHALFESLP